MLLAISHAGESIVLNVDCICLNWVLSTLIWWLSLFGFGSYKKVKITYYIIYIYIWTSQLIYLEKKNDRFRKPVLIRIFAKSSKICDKLII